MSPLSILLHKRLIGSRYLNNLTCNIIHKEQTLLSTKGSTVIGMIIKIIHPIFLSIRYIIFSHRLYNSIKPPITIRAVMNRPGLRVGGTSGEPIFKGPFTGMVEHLINLIQTCVIIKYKLFTNSFRSF